MIISIALGLGTGIGFSFLTKGGREWKGTGGRVEEKKGGGFDSKSCLL